MGLKIGRFLKKAAPFIGAAGGAFFGGPAGAKIGFTAGAALRPTSKAAAFAGVGAGVPALMPGGPSFGIPQAFGVLQAALPQNGGVVVPAAAGAVPMIVRGMTMAVARAIGRLGLALGIPVTIANLSRIGTRLWRTVTAFARRHPGLSVVSFLVSLGLTVEEASEFLMWGQLRQRRRRARGISARDIRIARRTIRKVMSFQRELGGVRRLRPGPRRRLGAGGGVVIAQQD